MGDRGKKDNSRKSGAARRRQEQRREEAAARQKVYDGLMPQDKLARLESRPGESVRERERIDRD